MTKSERNNAFSKMLKEFPKVFGRVSFRERLMLGVAFDYAITETHDLENKLLGERCNQLLKDKGELTDKIEKMKCCYNCSKWYDGECEESPKSKTFFCADFKCDKWECIE